MESERRYSEIDFNYETSLNTVLEDLRDSP